MEPNFNSAPAINSAPQVAETAEPSGNPSSMSPEQLAPTGEGAPAIAQAQPSMTQPLPMPAQPQPTSQSAAVPSGAVPAAIPADDDNTALEHAYIEKAKAIVAGTADDPYNQSREISLLKAESLRRLHAKEVKVEG